MNHDDLNLDALANDDGPGMTEQEISDNGKEILWLTDEMAPPENIAYSLRRIDSGLSELLETQERIASALETLAQAAKDAAKVFAG